MMTVETSTPLNTDATDAHAGNGKCLDSPVPMLSLFALGGVSNHMTLPTPYSTPPPIRNSIAVIFSPWDTKMSGKKRTGQFKGTLRGSQHIVAGFVQEEFKTRWMLTTTMNPRHVDAADAEKPGTTGRPVADVKLVSFCGFNVNC